MQTRVIYIILILLISSLCSTAFSQESLICLDALKTVCDDTQIQRSDEQQYLLNIKQRDRSDLKKENEKILINPINILMFKNYMKQAIDESNFSLLIRLKFKSTINSVIITNYDDYYKIISKDPIYLSLLNVNCGLDGMEDNGFFAHFKKNRYVVLCPGTLLAIKKYKTEQEKISAILQIVSHELAHHIDNLRTKDKVYEPFLSCLSKNYIDQFNKTNEDQKFCDEVKDQNECNEKVISTHSHELVADQWASKVVGIYARKQAYSVSQTDTLITNNYKYLCDSEDVGIHPSGAFRIATLLRSSPEVSNYLSCNNSLIQKPTCTFDGEMKL